MENSYDYKMEVNKAIQACDVALAHLNEADRCLSSAGNWGVVDLLGGGLLSSLAKHSKMDDANRELQRAKDAVKALKDELVDVGRFEEINVNTGDFLSFADIFFDGFISDWLMQSRIKTAKQQINDAILHIKKIRFQLEASL